MKTAINVKYLHVYSRFLFHYYTNPYYGTERYYQVQFSKEDHARLFDCLKCAKGKFILSYNDCEFVRELYKDFNIDEV